MGGTRHDMVIEDSGHATGLWLAGDREGALASIYRTELHWLLLIAGQVVGRDSATEAVRLAFVRLWRFPERFDPTVMSLDRYLRVSTRGAAIDLARRRPARLRQCEIDSRTGERVVEDPVLDVADRAIHQRLDRAIEALTPEHRSVIGHAFDVVPVQ